MTIYLMSDPRGQMYTRIGYGLTSQGLFVDGFYHQNDEIRNRRKNNIFLIFKTLDFFVFLIDKFETLSSVWGL